MNGRFVGGRSDAETGGCIESVAKHRPQSRTARSWHRSLRTGLAILLWTAAPGFGGSVDSSFVYQGQLKQAGVPVNNICDFEFSLWENRTDPSPDSQIGPTLTFTGLEAVPVVGGMFAQRLDFGEGVFDGGDRYLQIALRCPPAIDFTELAPRQTVTATPYALFARQASWYGLLYVPPDISDGDADTVLTEAQVEDFVTNGSIDLAAGTTLDGAAVSTGLHTTDTNAATLCAGAGVFLDGNGNCVSAGSGSGWGLTGNAGTTAGANFVGTTDDEPLQLHVNGDRALRIEPNGTSPNLVGGWDQNNARAGVVGGTVSGGGSPLIGGNPRPNVVADNYGVVAGGSGNQAGSSNADPDDANHATVGGGYANSAGASVSTVGGGWYNRATGDRTTIGGGWNNLAGSRAATVGGGRDNQATGTSSTVPGGHGNIAAGDYSFAAGLMARASHPGAFVWADSTNSVFESTGNDQFLIRASGGVGIGKTNPQTALDVNGTVAMTGFKMTLSPTPGYVLTSDAAGAATWQPPGEFTLPFEGSGNSGSSLLSLTNNGAGTGLYAAGGSYGVHGLGSNIGVFGQSNNVGGSGVQGFASAGSGNSCGGQFFSNSATGRGVYGWSSVPNGVNYGGLFETSSPDGFAVHGRNYNKSTFGYIGGPSYAVYGKHDNTGSYGALGGNGFGVSGLDGNSYSYGYLGYDNCGVWGLGFQGGTGVYGETGSGYGVHGNASGSAAKGVYGTTSFSGDSDDACGVYGIHTSSGSFGLLGGQYYGVRGVATGYGVWGTSFSGEGVYGQAEGGTGVHGIATSGKGVHGWANTGTAVYAEAIGTGGVGLYAKGGAGGRAAIFDGILQINGGADLSEQFDIRSAKEGEVPKPGMVVSIDPKRPGDLMVSREAYDRRVAGIISGAGGIKPGMLMGQSGSKADGANPVALTGRVYCWADASFGGIEPGDLLTTSDTPGHTMKVSDHARAQGAIIGKAMTPLTKGRGLILVLVSLQ